jgi:hypothetical protein
MKTVNLSADSRKRISLNKLLPDLPVSILEPMVEIPAREAWLHQNEKALNKVKTGLSEKGTIDRGSFAKYIEEEYIAITPQP